MSEKNSEKKEQKKKLIKPDLDLLGPRAKEIIAKPIGGMTQGQTIKAKLLKGTGTSKQMLADIKRLKLEGKL